MATKNKSDLNEYGFYANVNPKVDHPRWSQASERVIGAGVFGGRQPTLMFNGYEKQVRSERIWFLREREPEGGPPALVAGERTRDRRRRFWRPAADAHVQWLRKTSQI